MLFLRHEICQVVTRWPFMGFITEFPFTSIISWKSFNDSWNGTFLIYSQYTIATVHVPHLSCTFPVCVPSLHPTSWQYQISKAYVPSVSHFYCRCPVSIPPVLHMSSHNNTILPAHLYCPRPARKHLYCPCPVRIPPVLQMASQYTIFTVPV